MRDFGDCAAQVAAAFDLGEPHGPMREVAGGEQARIWRLETDEGVFAVKEPRAGFAPRGDGVDIAFQEAAREQTDIAIPASVRRSGQPAVVTVAGREVRVSEWWDLAAPDRDLDPESVGRLLADLHSVRFPLPGGADVDPWYWAPVGESAWRQTAARLDETDAPFATTLSAEIPHLLALEAILEPPANPQMCHRDLWENNLLQDASGRLCVIDWDNCGAADPAHELAMLVYAFGGSESGRQRRIHASYLSAGGPARLVRPEQMTMVIAQFGHFWQMAAEAWLDPDSTDDDRAHAEERVAELMDPPLRVSDCEALISALG